MNEQQLRKLYDALTIKYDIGTWDQFKLKMATVDQRKNFYNAISKVYDIGDYNSFESRLSGGSTSSTTSQTTSTQTSSQIDPTKVSSNFSCILNNSLWKTLLKQTNDSNHLMYTVSNITGKEFHFFADGKFMYNDIEPYKTNIMGTWQCDGDSNFLIKTEDKALFDSKVNKWSYNVNESNEIKKLVYKNLISFAK